MLQQLISHSPDIAKLAADGYEMSVDGAYLIIHHIPYVNAQRQVKYGCLVTALNLSGPGRTSQPSDHTMFFQGEKPCDNEGKPLVAIINSSGTQQLTKGLQIHHYFSSKPKTGSYPDYYEKVRTYAGILSAQAQAIDPLVTARPGRVKAALPTENVFQYPDTNSARARIDTLNKKFYDQRIAIVGLGGTGSYILDLVAKTPVREIHLYDGDVFHVHNAFRAPGAPPSDQFNEHERLLKTDYYRSIYSQMHKGVQSHAAFISKENLTELASYDFVFLCVDKNEIRYAVAQALIKAGKSFIDVGLGVHIIDERLVGTVRVTSFSQSKNDHIDDRIGQIDEAVNEYAPNIQIADLNCLNAVLAVIKWKKIIGFYQDLKHEHNSLFLINTAKMINDDHPA
jgi:tRNA A37 threonylcarbamoyladenosine dehydratase